MREEVRRLARTTARKISRLTWAPAGAPVQLHQWYRFDFLSASV